MIMVNKEPDIEKLRYLQEEKNDYNVTNSCDRCGDQLILHISAFREHDENGKHRKMDVQVMYGNLNKNMKEYGGDLILNIKLY